jgi:hypothetical protein
LKKSKIHFRPKSVKEISKIDLIRISAGSGRLALACGATVPWRDLSIQGLNHQMVTSQWSGRAFCSATRIICSTHMTRVSNLQLLMAIGSAAASAACTEAHPAFVRAPASRPLELWEALVHPRLATPPLQNPYDGQNELCLQRSTAPVTEAGKT